MSEEPDTFELWISKRLQVPLNIEEERASDQLGSVSLIKRTDQTFETPVILQGPKAEQKSPEGHLILQANTDRALSEGRFKVVHASPETRRVKIHKLNETSENIQINTDTHNIYTLTKGHMEPFPNTFITDNTILLNDEGIFLIRVVDTKESKTNGIVGVREKPDMIPQLAFGTAQILNAR